MNVLIVSPAFPPFSGVGGQRMASFSKHLIKHGVNVHVLRNEPSLWGEKNLKADVPSGLTITDIKADQDFKGNAKIYYEAIKSVLNSQPVDIILYSVGPFYTLLTLRLIKRHYPHKQVIDFRDLWSYEQRGSKVWLTDLKYRIVQFLFRWIERPAVNQADGIVVVTPGDAAIMRKHYPKYRDTIFTIFNGYDEVDLKAVQSSNAKSAFQLVSLGKLGYYAPHLAKRLFDALDAMSFTHPSVKLLHVGQKEAVVETLLPEVKHFTYECTGYVDYSKGLQLAAMSDVGVIVYDHPTGYGTKIFDYIAVNKPILLITDKAKDLSDLVLTMKNGFVCRSTEETLNALQTIVSQKITNLDDRQNREQFSRSTQNQRYLELLHQLLEQ